MENQSTQAENVSVMSIGKIALALSKAQGIIRGATKNSENPFFKNSYADLASVWDACRDALSKHELAVTQVPDLHDGTIVLRTILMHSSGESISGVYPIMVGEKATAQQIGSAITYARRYALAAMIGIAPEDDDGNAASQTTAKASGFKKEPNLRDAADEFVRRLGLCTSLNQVTDLTTKNNRLLLTLKEKHPALYENVSVAISRTQEAFQLAGEA